MPYNRCLICKKEFYIKPNHVAKGWGKYCSRACQSVGQLKGKKFNCFTCNKATYKSPSGIKKSKSGKFFCSKKCQTIWRNSILYIGESHPNWKNGNNREYRKKLIQSDIPQACKKCGCNDERVLIVHHLDKNHQNNSVDNLVWLCINCHYLVHNYRVKI